MGPLEEQRNDKYSICYSQKQNNEPYILKQKVLPSKYK